MLKRKMIIKNSKDLSSQMEGKSSSLITGALCFYYFSCFGFSAAASVATVVAASSFYLGLLSK